MDKNYKTQAMVFGITGGVLLVAIIIIGWQYISLRKDIAKVATKTANPSGSAISAAVTSLETTADAIV